jgi:hypothetical protein
MLNKTRIKTNKKKRKYFPQEEKNMPTWIRTRVAGSEVMHGKVSTADD